MLGKSLTCISRMLSLRSNTHHYSSLDYWKITAHPLGCKESWKLSEGEVTTCERGDNGSLYQWAFYFVPLWFVIM